MSLSRPATPPLPASEPSADARIRFLRRLAWWMDGAVGIPGTRFRIGIDAVIGVIPGLGDVAGLVIGSLILAEALHRGAPSAVLGRMLWNLARDAVVGTIPVVGDIHDMVFRANQRNMVLLEAHCRHPEGTRAASVRWMAAVVLGLAGATAASIVLAWAILRTLLT